MEQSILPDYTLSHADWLGMIQLYFSVYSMKSSIFGGLITWAKHLLL